MRGEAWWCGHLWRKEDGREWIGRKRGSFAMVLSEKRGRGREGCACVVRARRGRESQTAHREATAVRPLEQRGAVPSPWESPVERHTNPSRLQGAPTADELSLMLRGLLIRLSALDGQLEDNRGACGLANRDSDGCDGSSWLADPARLGELTFAIIVETKDDLEPSSNVPADGVSWSYALHTTASGLHHLAKCSDRSPVPNPRSPSHTPRPHRPIPGNPALSPSVHPAVDPRARNGYAPTTKSSPARLPGAARTAPPRESRRDGRD